MKKYIAFLLIATGAMVHLNSQVAIRSADMFSEVGQYYRAYVNSQPEDPFAGLQSFAIREQVGESGGPHLWDFSQGPTDEIRRFDYVNPQGTIVGASFPEAPIAERMTLEANGDVKWLLFDQIPLVGRRVFGAFDPVFDEIAIVFDQPIIDFPDPMQFGDKWTTSLAFTNSFSILGIDFPVRITQISEFEVDAFGFIELPNLGFGDVIRVNELVSQTDAIESNVFGGSGDPDIDAELGGGGSSFQDIQKTYHRNIYFIRPGLGIVAQITSSTSEAAPGPNFQEAIYFVRMFETNKTPPEVCEAPSAVDDLEISFASGRALLKWGATDCTDSYRVEYSSLGGVEGSWKSVGETQGTFMVDPLAAIDPVRIYRVISRKGDFTIGQ